MKTQDFGRHALTSCVAAALLAGCGGSQPPIGAPAQGLGAARYTSAGDLLYAGGGNYVYVYSYPRDSLVQTLQVGLVTGLCSDASGDVYVTTQADPDEGFVYEYVHGGSNPIATLADYSYAPHGCSVDPRTGSLAVVDYATDAGVNVGIYANAQGTPTYYSDPSMGTYSFCAYDAQGNLFVDGRSTGNGALLTELPKGSGSFTDITLNKSVAILGPLEPLAKDLAMGGKGEGIYQIQISGDAGTIVRTTRASGLRSQWLIQGRALISPYGPRGKEIAEWTYPKGGKPSKVFGPDYSLSGVAISVAPH